MNAENQADGQRRIKALWTYEELAARLNCSVTTAKRYVARKKIPAVRLSYKVVRFRAADVERAIEQLTVKNVAR